MGDPMKERVDREMGELRAEMQALASTPVDVVGTLDDTELDTHVWLRLSDQISPETPVDGLPDDLRAYYVTRSFEWEFGSGGVTGFLDWHEELGPLVAAGYRHLALNEAAAAFERFWASTTVERLRVDPSFDADDDELGRADALAEAVGFHDADRVAFIRAHPRSFAI